MSKTRFIIVMATAIFLTSGMASQAQSPARLADMGQINRAKQAYLKMYKLGQTNETDFYYTVGRLFLNIGMRDSSAIFFKKGTEVEMKNPMNYIGLARYFYLLGDSVQAKNRLKIAAGLARNNQNYNLAMGEMYMQPNPGRLDLAEQYIRKAMEQKSNSANAHILMGDLFLGKGSAGDAANEYKQAIFFDKRNPVTYFKSGMVYAKGHIYQDAVSSMQKAIACDSGYIPAWRELGEIYLLFDKYRLARESYDKYISLIEPDSRDLVRYASMLVLDKDFEKAAKIITKLQAENIQDPKLLRIQAYTDFETGKFDTGLVKIRDFFAKVPAEETITSDYDYYAQLLLKNSLDSLAIPQYLKIIERDTTRKALYGDIAKIYEKMKDYPSAAKYYELNLVTKEQPTQVDYFKIGRLYYLSASNKLTTDSIQRMAQAQLASKQFLKVTEMSPANHLGWFWEARTQALLDPESEAGAAKPFYEKALNIMEQTPEKFKKEITESLKYLGYYFYLKFDKASIDAKKADIAIYRDSSALFWTKIIAIDPADKQAGDAIKALTQQKKK